MFCSSLSILNSHPSPSLPPSLPPSLFFSLLPSLSRSPHPSEERVMSYYRMMNGLSRGEAVFKYLDIIQSLPMYSMHFFEVKVRPSTNKINNCVLLIFMANISSVRQPFFQISHSQLHEYRVLPSNKLRQSGWAWFGRSL